MTHNSIIDTFWVYYPDSPKFSLGLKALLNEILLKSVCNWIWAEQHEPVEHESAIIFKIRPILHEVMGISRSAEAFNSTKSSRYIA